MSVLSATTQQQVEDQLVSDHILTASELQEFKAKASKEQIPLFSALVRDGKVTNEVLTKTTARVTKVPYVNLTEVHIDAEILALLPQDIAERYMAVPLGEMQRRLVVAMLDADNVQAVDFLSNKIGRPLKVYVASEEGIRAVLKQYSTSIDKDVMGALEKAGGGQEKPKIHRLLDRQTLPEFMKFNALSPLRLTR